MFCSSFFFFKRKRENAYKGQPRSENLASPKGKKQRGEESIGTKLITFIKDTTINENVNPWNGQ